VEARLVVSLPVEQQVTDGILPAACLPMMNRPAPSFANTHSGERPSPLAARRAIRARVVTFPYRHCV
jgi:hypothetical protein